MKNRGIIKLSYSKLADLMDIPEGHEIVRVLTPMHKQSWFEDSIEIMIEGPSMPVVYEGDMPTTYGTLGEFHKRTTPEDIK